ncbi:putative HC-toxin efflux carrier TOXA [Cyphellophora attinorum]|uniref:Putative HC-toxin efflux carrier TOXA n=1 Tax=Cyphellophora attinorum TaxID=1664694 RepID=A0A0N1H1U4_9EURO|nr:putative HC-toxin efflux carrier TOXA [Phialophora attinorum]KPI38213.1 putative HC-toxin efflux carrier TOXA [Phialophora attinorum]
MSSTKQSSDLDGHQCTTSTKINATDVDKSYFYSLPFLGTYLALCFNLSACTGGFALIAPVLSYVNADIGPDPSIIWVALVYSVGQGIGLALIGRLSDLFGRRYFLIFASALGLIGCIVCATAKSVPILIGGQALVGLSAAGGSSYTSVLSEMVPVKHRFPAQSFIYLWQLPTAGFGPALAYIFILNTKAGWRWCYYYNIIWNALTLILFIAFYFPPTFEEKHGRQDIWRWLKDYDYFGTFLFVAGEVLFLLGLSWGGSVYPWRSSYVVSTIVVGGITLIVFAWYETKMDLKEPFVPKGLFRRRSWVAVVILIGVCGGVYYAFALVWPRMVTALYSDPDDLMEVGYQACIVLSELLLVRLLDVDCHVRLDEREFKISAPLLLVRSVYHYTKARATALLFLGTFFIGWADGVAQIVCGIDIDDQKDIGVACGMMGTIRASFGAACAAIYSTILTNELTSKVPAEVVPAILGAGLPEQSVPEVLQAFVTGNTTMLDSAEGVTTTIIEIGSSALKQASADSYRTVFYSSMLSASWPSSAPSSQPTSTKS